MSHFKFSYIKLWHSDNKLYGHKLNSGSGKVSMNSYYIQYFMKVHFCKPARPLDKSN